MELDGDDGLLADIGGFSKAFARADQAPQVVAAPRGNSNPIEVRFDVASSAKPTTIEEEEMKSAVAALLASVDLQGEHNGSECKK